MDDFFDAIAAGDADLVRAMLHQTPALAVARRGGVSAVLWACYHHERALAQEIAEAAAEVDIFEAAALDRVDRVRDLLRDDPGLVTRRTLDGFPALGIAAYFGSAGSVAALLDAKADPDATAQNALGVAPLHSASAAGRADLVALLLDAGADPNVRQRDGWTPLHQAAHSGDVAMTEALLAAGAEPATAADDGATPADLAERAGHGRLATRLRDAAPGG